MPSSPQHPVSGLQSVCALPAHPAPHGRSQGFRLGIALGALRFKSSSLRLCVNLLFCKRLLAVNNFFPREDLNPHKQSQSLPCYPYTTGESAAQESFHCASDIIQKSDWLVKVNSSANTRKSILKAFLEKSARKDAKIRKARKGISSLSDFLPKSCRLYRKP